MEYFVLDGALYRIATEGLPMIYVGKDSWVPYADPARVLLYGQPLDAEELQELKSEIDDDVDAEIGG
ncbi:MAG: hypothetical protein JSS66_06340 [Armatimonadetes bacterium]|nr:hypothetical protein [Armatimonadota bacterium]